MKLIPSINDARNNFFTLIIIMICSALIISTVTISILYIVSFDEYRARLEEIAKSQARMIEASANYQYSYENKNITQIENILLLQLHDAYNHTSRFTETGEFIIAKRVNDNIKFLFTLNNTDKELIIPFNSDFAEPMEMALNEKSGVIVGLDYDGIKVLAAFEYIKLLNIGIVAKIDLTEIQAPYIRAILIVVVVIIVAVILSAILFRRVKANILISMDIERKKLLKANKKLKYEVLEHHETEDKLKTSREKLRQVIKMSPIPMIIAGLDKHIEFYNYKFTELFGYSIEDFEDGKILWNYIFPDKAYRHKAYSAWLRVSSLSLTEQESIPLQTWNITTKGGNSRECEVYITMTLDTTFIVLNDVTNQKKLERELVEAKENAEELSEVKSDFLSTMSHEIRTPINGVLGMTELLLGTEVNEEQEKFGKAIKISTNILLELVNDLLDISKIEAKMLILESFGFNLKSMLEDFIEIQNYKTRGKNISLILTLDSNIPFHLIGDPGRIRQVLLNLVGNAFKFTKSGDIVVNISKENENENNVTLKFSVKDTGIGIPEDKLNHIFDKFTQADASTTRKFGGTGLGLAICKELVEAMGGFILVESTQGVGSEFSFCISLEKQSLIEEKVFDNNLLVNNLEAMNVLIYSDLPTDSKHLSELMKYWNVNTQISSTQEDVISVLKDSRIRSIPIKILIIDIEESRWEAICRLIKSDVSIKDTQIIILTKWRGRGDVGHLGDIGFSSYLTKPLKKADLHDVLLTLMNFNGREHHIITKHTIREMLRNNRTILVADDNKINQKVATGILEKSGFIVDVVNDGVEAINYLSDRHYSLVLMDCNMPKQDGFDTTRIIRSVDSSVINHNIPIIAMTANVTESDRQKCFDNGMDEFISKPMDPNTLVEIINRTIK